MNAICTGCPQTTSMLITKSKQTIKVPSRWQHGIFSIKLIILLHFVQPCMCATCESKKWNQYSFAARAPEREGRPASEGYCTKLRFSRPACACECLQVPANTVPRFKKSLGACSVATAGKENQGSHFNCICLLVINLLVQRDRWGKWCINTNLAGLHWNY